MSSVDGLSSSAVLGQDMQHYGATPLLQQVCMSAAYPFLAPYSGTNSSYSLYSVLSRLPAALLDSGLDAGLKALTQR